jgi:signal transduction histidine kinase/DNA-binding response OmpR family regulator/ligand-binding sensor domain-containing protein
MPIFSGSIKYGRIPHVHLALVGLLAFQVARAHPQDSFTRFTTSDGLAQSMIISMHLDSRGFLWCGTKSGLSRYDGYKFQNFQNDPSDNASITAGVVTAIHECASGDLWIGFADGSVDIFHRAQDRFEHLSSSPSYPAESKGQAIYEIVEDPLHRHWFVSAYKGLMEVDDTITTGSAQTRDDVTHRFVFHRKITVGGKPFDCTGIWHLYADKSGGLWIQSASDIVVVNRTLPAPLNIPHPRESRYDYVGAHWEIYEDRRGLFWFACGEVLISLDLATGKMERYTLAISNRPKGWATVILEQEDHQGNLIIVSNGFIHRIDPRRPDHQTDIELPPETARWQTAILFQSAAMDSSDGLWLGTQGYGLYHYNMGSDRFGFVPKISWWQAVQKTVDDLGIPARSDPKKLPYEFSGLYRSHVVRNHDGKEWALENVHRSGGILSFDSSSRGLYQYPSPEPGVDFPGIWYGNLAGLSLCSAEDDSGNFWIGQTILGKFGRAGREPVYFVISGDSLIGLEKRADHPIVVILTVSKDRDGSFWLGTLDRGVYHFDPVSLALKNYSHRTDNPTTISRDHVLTLHDDPGSPDQYLWVGTDGGGLNRMEKQSGRCLRILPKDGLPDNVVYSILPDRRGYLWMSTNQGLSRMDPGSLTFRNYDIADGLKAMEFNRNEYFQDSDGKMYFGTADGINIFKPEEISDNRHVPPVVFTELRLQNVPVSVRDSASVLSRAITETRELRLSHEQNVITLEYAALDFANPGKNLYSHKLEGFGEEWSPPSANRSATYTNLNPGEYTFRVRGSNSDGAWNMEGASLKLIILPPWYRTAWAYFAYAFLLLGGLFLFRRYDLKRVRLKDQLDLEQVRSAQLQEVDQLKMRFFQNVSHEFRTPLTLILGPVEKLLDNLQDQTQKRELRVIRRNAQRLLALINQILDISKLEAGGMKLKASESDLVPFVRGVVMAFHSLAERKGIFLDVQSEIPSLLVFFDKDKLEKVLVNLIGNSFKFTPESGEIIVRISSSESKALIAVRDTGIGIPKEMLPHIFDRFYQVDSSTTRTSDGTGIGLSLVKDFVDLHRGSIEVMSEPGRGTEFTIQLLLGREHLTRDELVEQDLSPSPFLISDGDDDAATGPSVEPLVATTGKPIILVVEDNSDVRDYIRSCLDSTYVVTEAKDGVQGFALAEDTIPDLVLSDVMMPKMDGYELCAQLKRNERTSHIPVILLTAKAAMEDRIGGLETGADDYLVKPFDTHELLARVKNLIEMRRKLRETFGKELVTLRPDEIRVTPVEQAFLRKVMDVIEQRMGDESFAVEELASHLNMSYTQLHRKLKAVTNQSTSQFIRSMRLKRGMELLSNNGGTVSEIAYSVGFASPAYFTKCFLDEFGKPPSAVRKST